MDDRMIDAAHEPGVPPAPTPLRTAAGVVHDHQLAEARSSTLISSIAAAGATALWIVVGEWHMRSGTFFLFGLALLWAFNSWRKLLRLRRDGPLVARTPHELAADQSRVAEVARHQALLRRERPRYTYALMAAIGIVAAFQVFATEHSIPKAGLVKADVRAGEWWRLLSATLMHGSIMHIWFNGSALLAIGAIMEAYAPRRLVPLVFLVSAFAGSLASLVFLPDTTSVGASGGIMGMVAFLWVMQRRRPSEVPAWIGTAMLSTIFLTAYIGFFGIAFIDNAAHAGGAVAGALLGLFAIPREGKSLSPARIRFLDAAGWVALAVIFAGVGVTVAELMR
jgi:membrane associated rhomboid family serine protease